MATGFDRRNPGKAIFIRVLVTVWLLGLTVVLFATKLWAFALVTLVGAVVNSAFAFRASRTRRR